ncbi:MAG: DUF63 family protein [Candidatus Norongarragalinales archaeon]
MDWLQEYFVNPITRSSDYAPYNAVNTLVFAGLALLAAYLIYRGLQHFEIKSNDKFFFAVLPFVVFGSSLRVWEDAHWLPRAVSIFGFEVYPFVTPYIYVLTFILVAAGIAFARRCKAKHCFEKTLFNFGVVFAGLVFFPLVLLFKNWAVLTAITGTALIAAFFLTRLDFKRRIKTTRIEELTFFAQCLDGSATFWGVQFAGYVEQHVVGNFLFSVGGPFLFLIVKVAFVYLAVEVFRRETKEGSEARVYLLLLITIFGLAPGVRDALRITCGV